MMYAECSNQNFIITPALSAINEPAPLNIHQQKWQIVLSGYCTVELPCFQDVELLINPIPNAIQAALNIYNIPIPNPKNTKNFIVQTGFLVEQSAPFVALGSYDVEYDSVLDKRLTGIMIGNLNNKYLRKYNYIDPTIHYDVYDGTIIQLRADDMRFKKTSPAFVEPGGSLPCKLMYNITLLGGIVFTKDFTF